MRAQTQTQTTTFIIQRRVNNVWWNGNSHGQPVKSIKAARQLRKDYLNWLLQQDEQIRKTVEATRIAKVIHYHFEEEKTEW